NVGVYLSPDEHVFGGQADLFVAFAHVGAYGGHNLLFRKINLRVPIGDAEFAAAAAAGRHFDHAGSGAFVGNEQRLTLCRVTDLDLARQFFAVDRFAEEGHRLARFGAPFNYAINTEFVERIGLRDLPPAGAADDDLEIPAVGAVLDFGE